MGQRYSNDEANGVAVDASGNAYVTGNSSEAWTWVEGSNPPVLPLNPFTSGYGGDIFITMFSNAGIYQWHTFIGGAGWDVAEDIVVKGSNIFLTGHGGLDFTDDGVSPAIGHGATQYSDAFAAKLSTGSAVSGGGNLLWYTFLGGNDTWGNSIDADDAGMLYITGTSTQDLYSTPIVSRGPNATHGYETYAAKVNSNDINPSCLVWNTFMGGPFHDAGQGIGVDNYGNVFVGGDRLYIGVVLTMLNNIGEQQWQNLLYDYPLSSGSLGDLILDNVGNLFLTGYCQDPWPVSLGGDIIHEHHLSVGNDAFVAKIHTGAGVNQPPTIGSCTDPVTVNEGQAAENTGTVNDPDGDPLTLSVNIGTVVNNGDGTWSWSFGTSDGPAESQTVTVTADDGNGGTAEVAFALTVNNVLPAILEITLLLDPIAIDEQPVIVSATFSDPAGSADEPYTCTVDFGDGTGGHNGTVNGYTCTCAYTYAEASVNMITVTVTDNDGGSEVLSATDYIVIYDPSEGFVTGGGWIDSPEGAYIPDPTLTGIANFGFVSKYKKGHSVPTGNTQFQFNPGDLNFHSTYYQWMIIAGHKAMYKGDGTINGEGNFGFQLSAIDEDLTPSTDVDLFRIRIWDKDNNDELVYDNELGGAPNGDPTTEIGGGNITIHEGNKSISAEESGDEPVTDKPEEFQLFQNYPNPFNSTTSIKFELPKDTHVVLKVFDVVGYEVTTLVNQDCSAGYHSVEFDANKLLNGIYFYRLYTADYSNTKKMLLID